MTPDQLDAVLPRVPAGIPALTGDLTDPEERAVAVRWLLELYREADCVVSSPTPLDPHFGTGHYRAGGVVPRSAVIAIGEGGFPPPPHWAIPTRPSPPAPGITYHNGSEAR